jgi:NAD(P)-dependent dehydrogenase (short-subunit alcohol dehydrogenase family)
MNIDLTGKTAIITGSSEGIGFAIARGLADAGATVVLNGRTSEKTEKAVAAIAGTARGVAADLSTAEGHAALVAAEPTADIVVSNLGIFQPVDFFLTDDAVWDRHWQTNVMPGVRLARSYLPGMEERHWGRFLLLGSESAFNIPVEMIHYGVTKTADVALARGLAKRMAGTGVTVNSILPGPTLSEGVAAMLEDQRASTGRSLEEVASEFVAAHRPSSIIRRAATVTEVANMVVYLASSQASATTGASVRVDGGVIETI